jgi:hypothetical protein
MFPPGEVRQREGRNRGVELQLFEGHRGEEQHRGAADLLQTVDVVMVAARLSSNAGTGHRHEHVAIAEDRGLRWACLCTGSDLATLQPRLAQGALADARRG